MNTEDRTGDVAGSWVYGDVLLHNTTRQIQINITAQKLQVEKRQLCPPTHTHTLTLFLS